MTSLQTPGELFDLSGQVAVVTGASSGLGDRFVRVLHAAGASVVAVARRSERLAALADELDRVLPVTADLADDSAVKEIVPQTMQRHGRLDIVVNNAGFGAPLPAVEEPIDAFRRTLEVNLVGAFHLARLAAEPMIATGSGSIINVSSILGLVAAWRSQTPRTAPRRERWSVSPVTSRVNGHDMEYGSTLWRRASSPAKARLR